MALAVAQKSRRPTFNAYPLDATLTASTSSTVYVATFLNECILLTGMSGTGKSTLIATLTARSYKAIDADCDAFSMWTTVNGENTAPGTPVEAERDWVWRADCIRDLLATENADVLFLSGCASNMGQFLPQFDHVVLLSAPAAIIVERLRTRVTNAYGKQPEEVAHVLNLIASVEPLLRGTADHAINTDSPLDEVVATLLWLAE